MGQRCGGRPAVHGGDTGGNTCGVQGVTKGGIVGRPQENLGSGIGWVTGGRFAVEAIGGGTGDCRGAVSHAGGKFRIRGGQGTLHRSTKCAPIGTPTVEVHLFCALTRNKIHSLLRTRSLKVSKISGHQDRCQMSTVTRSRHRNLETRRQSPPRRKFEKISDGPS